MTPYEVLHIPENSSIRTIKERYKILVKLFHPDKYNTKTNNDHVDSMSEKEKYDTFLLIQAAYKKLKKHKCRENDMPSENVEYKMQPLYESNKEETFNNILFNKQFDDHKKSIKEKDPNSRGYSEFNSTSTNSVYNISDVYKNGYKKQKKSVKLDEIVQYNDSTTSNFYEFGLSKIENFSTSVGSKNSLTGMDLQSAYKNSYIDTTTNFDDTCMDKNQFDNAITNKMRDRVNLDSSSVYLSKKEEMDKIRNINKIYEQRRQIQQKRDDSRSVKNIVDYCGGN